MSGNRDILIALGSENLQIAGMALILRLLCVVVSFAFIAGTTAHGLAAAKMELGMLNSDMIADSSGEDCSECFSDENSASSCELSCHSPVSFLSAENTIDASGSAKRIVKKTSDRLEAGIVLGLDPSPPRTIILI
ncbi:hypothetical protein [Parasedimentitalea psychrophila]|uniref:Uncharacterized protein n=1 Tax=Parasedimentitalea psychrophila TaxID=2997337 RepID=A0A9Y2KZU7_9RHOB|nr:hypothetical protein [Parasedimentitalea psychrophila]WIY25723.1 hypothetical protein QPJ95_01880 [Parasedimentitalea psychrophila]